MPLDTELTQLQRTTISDIRICLRSIERSEEQIRSSRRKLALSIAKLLELFGKTTTPTETGKVLLDITGSVLNKQSNQ